MNKLYLDRQESEVVNRAITHWENDGLLNEVQVNSLRQSMIVKGFDWLRLAKYSFWIALFCGLVAVGSLLINESILAFIKSLYNIPDFVLCILASIAAFLSFYFGNYWSLKYPEKVFSNQTFIFFGISFTAVATIFLGKTFDNYSDHFSLLILFGTTIYGVLAFRLKSRFIWIFTIIGLGCWFGTETGYQTNWGYYFLGMNYPMRFFVFGLIIICLYFLLSTKKWFRLFSELTYLAGLIYFFLALWILSLIGNLDNLDTWWHIKQINLIYWSIFALAVGISTLIYGLRSGDVIAREFGITFVLVLIYTKYFEFLWIPTNKALFFSILALSFWLIGRKAEKIWNIKK